MASTKEAMAIVLDVSPSMNQAPPGQPTSLHTSLDAIMMILQRKLFSESKDEFCLVLVGSTDTANSLEYEHITLARPLGMVDWDVLKYVQNDIQPSNSEADFLDGIVVAMDHLMNAMQGKRGFVSKRIILFSAVGAPFADDKLEDIIGTFKEHEFEFNVIGPDLDNDEDGGAGDGAGPSTNNNDLKEKTAQQRAGEQMLRHVIQEINGASYSFSEALPALSYFQSRAVRPTPWKCQMELGTMNIPIAGYIKVKEAKPKSYKNVYAREPDAAIKRLRTYHLNDEEETEVDDTDTVEGHRYGSTLVPFTADDKEAMKFRATKCFKILGFTKSENIKRHHYMGDNCMAVVAEKGDEAATIALSAIINAMHDTNMVAIVRRVYSAAAMPRIGCLVPHIKVGYECLFYTELPFSEDLRQFVFSSLPTKEEFVTNQNAKYKPTDEQLSAMDELIDCMDLTKADEDEDGDPREALKPKLTFNPHLQRLYQCLQHRAMNPDDPLPELSAVIAEYLKPPQNVATQSEPVIEKMCKQYKLTEITKKKEAEAATNIFKDTEANSGPPAKKMKVEEAAGSMTDIVKAKVTEVGTVTPIDDFRAIISQKDEDRFEEAVTMMQKRILQIVIDSFGAQFYAKAMDCLKVLRQESIKNGEPKVFNDFLREFKDTLMAKSRKDFWESIIKERVTLISKIECEDSRVSSEDAEAFIAETAAPAPVSATPPAEDEDDLLDMM